MKALLVIMLIPFPDGPAITSQPMPSIEVCEAVAKDLQNQAKVKMNMLRVFCMPVGQAEDPECDPDMSDCGEVNQ